MQILVSLPEDLDLERVSEIADKINDNNQNQNVYATSYNSTNDATPRNTPTPTNITNNHATQVNWAAAGHGKFNCAGSKFGEVPCIRTFLPWQNLLTTRKSK